MAGAVVYVVHPTILVVAFSSFIGCGYEWIEIYISIDELNETTIHVYSDIASVMVLTIHKSISNVKVIKASIWLYCIFVVSQFWAKAQHLRAWLSLQRHWKPSTECRIVTYRINSTSLLISTVVLAMLTLNWDKPVKH